MFLLSRTIRFRLSPSALVKLSHEWKAKVMWSHCYASSMFQFPNVPQAERFRAAREHLFAANLQRACVRSFAVWLSAACVLFIAEKFFSQPAWTDSSGADTIVANTCKVVYTTEAEGRRRAAKLTHCLILCSYGEWGS